MQPDVLMVINTSGLQFDDRLRKECGSLERQAIRPQILALDRTNRAARGRTPYGTEFETISLASRCVLAHRQGLLIKLLEMYLLFLLGILRRRPTALWAHDPEMFGLVALGLLLRQLGLIRRVVWDQHELPPETVLKSRFLAPILGRMMRACDCLVVANTERRDYLIENLGEGITFGIVENFADRQFADLPVSQLPSDLRSWLRKRPYFLAQGGANPGRYVHEVITAVLRLGGPALVVVGPCTDTLRADLRLTFGDSLDRSVFFTGMVPQLELSRFIDHSLASVVLYSTQTKNSYFCAPNRMYQALCRGIPVLVGHNPPMRRIVEDFGNGVVLTDDGRTVAGLHDGLACILREHKKRSQAATAHRDAFFWETQDTSLRTIFQGGRA